MTNDEMAAGDDVGASRTPADVAAATRNAAPKTLAGSDPRLDLAELSARLKQAWRPAWGVPAEDFPKFLDAQYNLDVLLDSLSRQAGDARGVGGDALEEATLSAAFAYLGRQESELKRNMADWYCNLATEERKMVLDRLAAIAANAPLKLSEEARTLLSRLEGPVTGWLASAHQLDPNRAELAELQQRVVRDIADLRDVPDFAQEGLVTLAQTPSVSTVDGIGTALYGRSNYDQGTNSYLATRYFVLFEVPLIPLGRYRVRDEADIPRSFLPQRIPRKDRPSAYQFLGRVPLRRGDKLHIAVAAAVVVAAIIIAIVSFAHPGRGYRSGQSANPTARQASSGSPGSASPEYSAGNSTQPPLTSEESASARKIDADTAELARVETNLRSMESLLQSYQDSTELCRSRLERMENDMQAGVHVDKAGYESVLRRCNHYVALHNSESQEYNSAYQEYEQLLDETNKQIDDYNHGIDSP